MARTIPGQVTRGPEHHGKIPKRLAGHSGRKRGEKHVTKKRPIRETLRKKAPRVKGQLSQGMGGRGRTRVGKRGKERSRPLKERKGQPRSPWQTAGWG